MVQAASGPDPLTAGSEQNRAHLLAVAYGMLGPVRESEDVLQAGSAPTHREPGRVRGAQP